MLLSVVSKAFPNRLFKRPFPACSPFPAFLTGWLIGVQWRRWGLGLQPQGHTQPGLIDKFIMTVWQHEEIRFSRSYVPLNYTGYCTVLYFSCWRTLIWDGGKYFYKSKVVVCRPAKAQHASKCFICFYKRISAITPSDRGFLTSCKTQSDLWFKRFGSSHS